MEYTEFLEWGRAFERELENHEKIDYYLAQIAMYCHMPNSDKKEFHVNDYLVKFKTKADEAVKLPVKTFCQIMKAAFGIKDKNNG